MKAKEKEKVSKMVEKRTEFELKVKEHFKPQVSVKKQKELEDVFVKQACPMARNAPHLPLNALNSENP